MDPSLKKRIDRAWAESKAWITEFDGTPTIALLVDAPVDSLLPGLRAVTEESENFRITAIPGDNPDSPQFIPVEAVSDQLALLRQGKVLELSINYAVRKEDFDLDIHMVLFPIKADKVALELDWWSDQVFSAETDDYAQFTALMNYFIHLQNLFSAPSLFISPEAGKDLDQDADSWVEV